jgi:hypothetical protein
MQRTFVAIAFTCVASISCDALAQGASPETSFKARVQERYCERLRVSPEAYVQFVQRLSTVHGYTYSDFVPEYPGAPVKADCRVTRQRVADVQRLLGAGTDRLATLR